ncbi:MAG: hypothetical protein JXC31_04710 [Acholeplasmataceae bacterium]|nr:hypothetical protein [Acholeplasmataceae bacterium]
MNNIARKLVLSALTVVLTVAALGTTTFAWFTLTNTAVVQPFEAQIVADTGIEVALGAAPSGDLLQLDWVTALLTEDVEAYIASSYGGTFRFNHVTTSNGVDFFTLGIGELSGATTGYLELPLHFRSNSANAIDWTAVTLTGGSLPWTSDVAFTAASGTFYPSGSSFNVDASDSMRISIQEVAGARTSPAAVVYEKPAAGTNLYLGTGGDFTDLVALDDDNEGAYGSYNYYFAKTGQLPFGSGAVITASSISAVVSEQVLQLTDGVAAGAGNTYYGQVVIRVWLEGYDQNAYNSVLARLISAGFTFEGSTI